MKVYLLEWHFSDGYDHSNNVLGVYSSEESAYIAGDEWIKEEDVEYYTYTVTEMELDA